MTVVDLAVSRFDSGFSCSQAVFSALAEELGIDCDSAVKVAAGFGGGMGRMAGTCGAVTGAFMALGVKFGGTEAEQKSKTYELVREFAKRFTERNESLQCRDILGVDISTEAGWTEAKEKNLHSTVCAQVVRDAAEIAKEILESE